MLEALEIQQEKPLPADYWLGFFFLVVSKQFNAYAKNSQSVSINIKHEHFLLWRKLIYVTMLYMA